MPLFILDAVSTKTAPFIYPDEDLPPFPARSHYILGGCVYCWRKALEINPVSVAAGVLSDRIWHYVTEMTSATEQLDVIKCGLAEGNYDMVNNTILDIISKHQTPECMKFWYGHTKRNDIVWSIV